MNLMKKLLLLFFMVVPLNLFSMVSTGSRALQSGKSAVTPFRSSFTSFQPGKTQFGRTFFTKSYKPTNISLSGKTVSGLIPQRGMSTHYVQRSVTPSWQGGNQSFNAKYWIPLAAVFGLTLAPKGSALGEEYTAQEAAQLIGFKNIDDLTNSENILAFLNRDDYQNNAALFSIIVADNLHKILPALNDTLKTLQDHKSTKSLERIRYLNKVLLSVNDRNKVSLAQRKIDPFKEALESLLTVEYERPDGTKYKGKVGSLDHIKADSKLSHMIKGLNNDPQLRAHFLNQLAANKASYWGYVGGLNDIEKQFKEAYDTFKVLPQAYKDLAEMIAQDQGAYDNVKSSAISLPTLFNAVQEVEKTYSSQNNELPLKIKKEVQFQEPFVQEQLHVEKQEARALEGSFWTQWARQKLEDAKKRLFTKPTNDSQQSYSLPEID